MESLLKKQNNGTIVQTIWDRTFNHHNPCRNSLCTYFNHTLPNLLRTLPKDQKSTWPDYLGTLGFVYNAMPHATTGCLLYQLMFSHKAQKLAITEMGLSQ